MKFDEYLKKNPAKEKEAKTKYYERLIVGLLRKLDGNKDEGLEKRLTILSKQLVDSNMRAESFKRKAEKNEVAKKEKLEGKTFTCKLKVSYKNHAKGETVDLPYSEWVQLKSFAIE